MTLNWWCVSGASLHRHDQRHGDNGLTDKTSVFIPAKLLSYMTGIESGYAEPSCIIETVSIERGARELAQRSARQPGSLGANVLQPAQ
jgi:hypothetical protein